jgi:hypothetical protein
MVRITQLGTGNALVVEDETNPDSTPFVVKANGSIGIGTTNPQYTLDVIVAPGSYARIPVLMTSDLNSPTGNLYLESTGIRADGDIIVDGSVGIGTTNPTSKLFVGGEIRATGNVIAYYSSDIKLKNNIENIKNPIKKLMQINGVEFDWTDEYIQNKGGVDGYFIKKHDIGVIAQEIEKVLPEAVATRNDGEKAVKYELIVPLLIEAIKEQQIQINILKEKLTLIIGED